MFMMRYIYTCRYLYVYLQMCVFLMSSLSSLCQQVFLDSARDRRFRSNSNVLHLQVLYVLCLYIYTSSKTSTHGYISGVVLTIVLFILLRYFWTQLEIVGFVPTLMYFTYMFVMATLFLLITGTIGFYACYQFVWAIYSAIKVD